MEEHVLTVAIYESKHDVHLPIRLVDGHHFYSRRWLLSNRVLFRISINIETHISIYDTTQYQARPHETSSIYRHTIDSESRSDGLYK
jgi:hypothetical protein